MELVKKQENERPAPVEIENSEFNLDVDYVVMAIGSKLNEKLLEGLKTNSKGYIEVNERYETSEENVYAIGDNIGQKATVAWACFAGREISREELQ